MKKIGLLCLCLASLSIAGCFHIPDEDWLPSKNKPETIHKDDQVEQAINSFVDGMNMVSSQRNDMKSEEISSEGSDENVIEIENNGIIGNASVDGETGDIIIE